MRTRIKLLENGLKTAAYSFPQLETVAVAFGVRFGSVDEKPRINGSAHFLEHMLFKGTRKRTWKEINDQLKELGVRHNAFTDHETTVYFMQMYKGNFEKGIEILSDMVKNSTIPDDEFELERGPIINENLIHHDTPRYMLSDYMPMVLYKRHPARMPVGGDNERTIRKIAREDLLDIYNTYYTPRNATLAIYGGVTEGRAFNAASRHFGDLGKSYKRPRRSVAREKQARRSIRIARKGIKQTRLGIGFICREFRNDAIDEFVSLLAVERYLDDKLFEEIREKRGLSYDPMAAYNPYSTFGYIAAVAGIEPRNLNETKEIMLKEFERLQKGEINREELDRTKKALEIEAKTRRENTPEMAINTANFELMYGGSRLLDSLPELIPKVSLDNVREYCGRYINIDRYGMVLLKPA